MRILGLEGGAWERGVQHGIPETRMRRSREGLSPVGGPESKSQFCLFVFCTMPMSGKKCLEKVFAPLMYVQNDQRVMGIILRYVCWEGPHIVPLGRMG